MQSLGLLPSFTLKMSKADKSLQLLKSISKAFVLSEKGASFSGGLERLRHALAGSSGQLFLCRFTYVKLIFSWLWFPISYSFLFLYFGVSHLFHPHFINLKSPRRGSAA